MPAITEYATASDLGIYGINEAALSGIDPESLTAAIKAASQVADSYLRSQYSLPLMAVGEDLKEAVSVIATYRLLAARGYNPELGGDSSLYDRYAAAIAWLRDVSSGKASPNITDSSLPTSTGASTAARAMVTSSASRGYSSRGMTDFGTLVPGGFHSGSPSSQGGGGGFVGD